MLLAAAGGLQAGTLSISVGGTFTAIAGQNDPVGLAGNTFTLDTSISSTATPGLCSGFSNTNTCAVYSGVPVTLNVQGVLTNATCTATATINLNNLGGNTVGLSNCTLTLFGLVHATFTATAVLPSGSIPSTSPVSFGPAAIIAGNNSIAQYNNSLLGSGEVGLTGTVTGACTACLPNLTASPTSLTFTGQLGSTTPTSAQTITLSSSGAPISYNVTNVPSWLTVTPTSGTTPTGLSVTANPTGLTQSTSGSFTITSSGAANTPLTINVTFNLLPALTLNPGSVSFNYQTGGQTPNPVPVTVGSTGSTLTYSAVPSASWITVSPTSGSTGGSVNVGINPSQLPTGVSNPTGTVNFTAPNSVNSSTPKVLNVSVAVSTLPSIVVSTSPIQVSYQIGGATPTLSPLQVTSSGTSFTFSSAASVTSPPGGTWLTVNQSGSTTPGSITPVITPTGLTPGTYSGQLTVTASGVTNSPQNIPVTLTVTGPPALQAPASLTFTYASPGTPPAAQNLSVTSSAGAAVPISFTAAPGSGSAWLSVSPSTVQTTPTTLGVSVNTSGLSAGTYNGSVVLTATTASSTTTLTVPVTLTITSPLTADHTSLSFAYTVLGNPPSAQTVNLTTTGSPVPYTASTTQSWLVVSPGSGTTPTGLSVSINPTGLVASSTPYTANLVINAAAGVPSQITIPVSLTVSGAPTISVSPGTLSFSFQSLGSLPQAQPISVTSSSGNIPFTASATTSGNSGNWLSVTPNGTTPGSVSVSITQASLNPGVYSGTVTVASSQASNSPQSVSVQLTVTAAPKLSANPSSLSFNAVALSGTNPAPQTVMINTDSTAVSYAAAASVPWLSVTPSGGTAGSTQLSVSVNIAGLSQGAYSGAINITPTGAAPISIPVALTLSAPPNLSLGAAGLTFNYLAGGTVPAAQPVTVSSSGTALTFSSSAAVISPVGGTWLAVTGSGQTPGSVSVSLNPAGLSGLPAGTYSGQVAVTSSSAGNSPVSLPVTLVVVQAAPSPQSLSFAYQLGQSSPAPQTLSLTTIGGAVTFTATPSVTTPSGGTWLQVTPAGSASWTVSVVPGSLAAGNYSGNIVLTAATPYAGSLTVPVSFIVTSSPPIIASPSALSFNYQLGAPTTGLQQTVQITSGGATFSAAVAQGGNWLSLGSTTSGNVPGSIQVNANPTGLTAGTYSGSISITSAGAGNSPLSYPVTLVVTSTTISASPNPVTLSYQTHSGTAPTVPLAVTSSGSNVPFTVSTPSVNWLTVSALSGTTGGAPLNLSINTTNADSLAAGSYNTTLTISASSISSSVPVSVTLVVSAAPTISAAPQSISLSYQLGSPAPAPTSLSIASSGSALSFTATASTTGGGNWLAVSGGNTTPATLSVSLVTAGLAVGNYSGSITISSPGAANPKVTIPVTLAVTGAPSISVGPTSLTFAYQINNTPPASQQISVGSSGAALNFTATPSTSSGGGWLAVSASGSTTPATLTVSINTSGLSAGNYSGSITVSSPSAANPTTTIPVSLTVSAAPVLSAAPSALSFSVQVGGSAPAAQNFTVSASGSVPLAVSATATGGTWLSVTGSGSTPTSIAVSVNPAGLAAGTYKGNVSVTSAQAGNSPLLVPVTFTVTAAPPLVMSPTGLVFNYQMGGTAPAAQSVAVSGGTGTFTAAASGGTWLSVTPSGGSTPGSISVSVNPNGLTLGSYLAAVTLNTPNGSPQIVQVRLNVTTGGGQTQVSGDSLNFTYTIGGSLPAPQTLNIVTSSGASAAFSATAGGGTWLTAAASGSTTPGSVTVSVNPGSLGAGTYTGFVAITVVGATDSPKVYPVTLTVNSGSSLITDQSSLAFAFQTGGTAPAVQQLNLSTSDSNPLTYSSAVSNATWLSVSPASGLTPAAINLSVNTTGLMPGTYTGTVTFSVPGAAASSGTSVSVTLTVSTATAISSTPNSLTFQSQSGQDVPAAQTISVSSTGTQLPYTATTSGGHWLTAAPANGTTPGSISVTVSPAGLAAGTYNGTITITPVSGDAPAVSVPVTFIVDSHPSLSLSPSSLQFSIGSGGSAPMPQTLTLSSGASPLNFTAAASGATWLSVTPQTGAAPGSITVSVNPAGLAPGTYVGSVLVTPNGLAGGSQTAPVMLTIADGATTGPLASGAVNSASGAAGTFAPGTIISIFGQGLGPQSGQSFVLGSNGLVGTSLAGTRVLFDGIPAPVLYSSAGQVNAIIPLALAGQASTNLQVEYQGQRSASLILTLFPAAPGLFAADGSGKGQGAIVNQDGSVNSRSNPAPAGSVIVLFGTGGGASNPPLADGTVVDTTGTLALPATATIGGQNAEVLYAGPAPGLVAGVIQINLRIPAGAPSGSQPVFLRVGNFSSQQIQVAVK
ncbi:MAG TPA: hypothetical protein VFA33_03855 [Bryobacteraceae bacterium]|nr:hypothetical protein [Bryobacteraceae bacterium]